MTTTRIRGQDTEIILSVNGKPLATPGAVSDLEAIGVKADHAWTFPEDAGPAVDVGHVGMSASFELVVDPPWDTRGFIVSALGRDRGASQVVLVTGGVHTPIDIEGVDLLGRIRAHDREGRALLLLLDHGERDRVDWDALLADVVASERQAMRRWMTRVELARERATRKALKVRARRRDRRRRRVLSALRRDRALGRPMRWPILTASIRLSPDWERVLRLPHCELERATGADLDRLAFDRYGVRR